MNNGPDSSHAFLMDNEIIRDPLTTETSLNKFQKLIEEKYGLKFENYFDFHRWSCENYSNLWAETWSYLGIICSRTFDQVVDDTTDFADVPEWFRGAKLNYAENILRHPDDNSIALIISGEEKRIPEHVTIGQLRKDVALLSFAFRNAGIRQGDVVACFMSNRKEAIIGLLAAASVGALFSSINPLLGVNAVVSRFQQISPKVLLTIDRFLYNNEERNILEILPEIIKGLPSLKYVVIVPSREDSVTKDIRFIPKSSYLPDFLKMGLTPNGDVPPQEYDQLPFSHPLIISYTSGTTGLPKGIVHSAGSTLLLPLATHRLYFNTKSTDVILGAYSPGWITWDIYVAVIGLGAALVLHEGEPFFRSPTAFWDLVDDHKVTSSLIYPYVLEEMEKRQFLPGKHNSLKTFHTMYAGSSKAKARSYDFVYEKIKPDIFFAEIYGSTEFMSMFAGLNYSLPVHKEQIQIRALGIDIRCYNEEGMSVFDEKGELVITKPFPSMPVYFCNDPQKEKYRRTFFSKFPGVWTHGDICAISSKTGGMTIFGRSDETIKQAGARFGSSEIYDVVCRIDGVCDSLCVSKITRDGDDIAFLFVKMKEGHYFSEKLVQEIKVKIAKELSKRHVPKIILCAPEIPCNLNGKKMEVLVKKILSGARVNKESVSNPDCLSYYFDVSRTYAN